MQVFQRSLYFLRCPQTDKCIDKDISIHFFLIFQAPTQKNSESVDLPAGLPPSTVMPQTPTASTGGYLMPNAQAGMRYYATNSATAQSMVVPGVTTPTHPAVMGGHAAPRRPPPPYPAEMMGFDQAVLNRTELSESSGWQPQRPNSLALGQAGKKKG